MILNAQALQLPGGVMTPPYSIAMHVLSFNIEILVYDFFAGSGVYIDKTFKFVICRCSKIGTFLDTGWRCPRGGLKGTYLFGISP